MYDIDVLDQLEAVAEGLVVPAEGSAIVSVIAAMDRITAAVSEALARFEGNRSFEADGSLSMTAWLKTQCRMSAKEARRLSATAQCLASLPVTSAAWRSGELSTGQVQAIAVNVNDNSQGLFALHEGEVVPVLVPLSVQDTASVMSGWAARAEAILGDDHQSEEPKRSLHTSLTLDGRLEVSGSFDPESASLLSKALRLGQSKDLAGEPPRSAAERRADALVDVCRYFLDHQDHLPVSRNRPHVNVVIDYDELFGGGHGQGQVLDGPSLSKEVIRRLLCDANVHRVVTQGASVVLDYSTSTRVVSNGLFNALVMRDQHCRWPGCDRPPSWTDAHHVIPVEQGGPTCPANLVLLCRRHHTRSHLRGWRLKLADDATVEVTTPDGRTMTSRPGIALKGPAPPEPA